MRVEDAAVGGGRSGGGLEEVSDARVGTGRAVGVDPVGVVRVLEGGDVDLLVGLSWATDGQDLVAVDERLVGGSAAGPGQRAVAARDAQHVTAVERRQGDGAQVAVRVDPRHHAGEAVSDEDLAAADVEVERAEDLVGQGLDRCRGLDGRLRVLAGEGLQAVGVTGAVRRRRTRGRERQRGDGGRHDEGGEQLWHVHGSSREGAQNGRAPLVRRGVPTRHFGISKRQGEVRNHARVPSAHSRSPPAFGECAT